MKDKNTHSNSLIVLSITLFFNFFFHFSQCFHLNALILEAFLQIIDPISTYLIILFFSYNSYSEFADSSKQMRKGGADESNSQLQGLK